MASGKKIELQVIDAAAVAANLSHHF